MNFKEQRNKSRNLHQYECCKKRWWGDYVGANMCGTCNSMVKMLPLLKMVGIGWFKCKCGRKYAGFSRGDVTSKCHGCEVENLPSFILPGDSAKKLQSTDKRHYCSACEGSYPCPIINENQKNNYQQISNKLNNNNSLSSNINKDTINKTIFTDHANLDDQYESNRDHKNHMNCSNDSNSSVAWQSEFNIMSFAEHRKIIKLEILNNSARPNKNNRLNHVNYLNEQKTNESKNINIQNLHGRYEANRDHKNHVNNMNRSNKFSYSCEAECGYECDCEMLKVGVYRDYDESDLNYSKISNNTDKPEFVWQNNYPKERIISEASSNGLKQSWNYQDYICFIFACSILFILLVIWLWLK